MVRAIEAEQEATDRMNHHLRGAKLIGYNELGHVCVWSGGYSFNVYDAAGSWHEVQHFTSGALVNPPETEVEELATERMKMEGFTVV